MVLLIVVIVLLVVGFFVWKAVSGRSDSAQLPNAQLPEANHAASDSYAAPERAVEAAQVVVAQPAPVVTQPVVQPAAPVTPAGTAHLDEPDAVRPSIDVGTLASARSAVATIGAAVPEGVLADALLDTTPDQLRQMFAAVPQDVLHEVVDARDNVSHQPLKKEEAAQLQGMADSLDDLDIWNFGETKA